MDTKLLISDKIKKILNKIFGTLASSIIAFVLLYFTFRNVDLNQAFNIIFNSSIFYLILFTLSFFLSHVLRAIRWQLIMKSVKEISFFNSFTSVMVGYGVNCGVPRLGELYRSLFIGRLERVSRTIAMGTIIVERIIDILFLGISVLISVLIYSGNLYSEILWLKSALIYGSIIMTILVVVVLLLIKNREVFFNVLNKVFSKSLKAKSQRFNSVFRKLFDGFSSIKNSKTFYGIIIYSVLIMLVYGFTSFLAFFVLRINLNHEISYEMGWIVMTLSAFGIVIPTPGGTGSYHIIVKSVLETLYGFNASESSAFALMTHIFSYIAFLSTMFALIRIVNVYRSKSNLDKVNFISVIKASEREDE